MGKRGGRPTAFLGPVTVWVLCEPRRGRLSGPLSLMLAMQPPEHDRVLLTGTDEALNDYIEHSGKCLVVDWRSDEGDLTDALAELLPAGWLSGTYDDEDLYVTYRGARHKVGLRLSPADRYIWLRRMNEIMAGDYELRAFRHTLGDDTHCFLLAPCNWWSGMQAAFPKELGRVFARITKRSKFP